MMHVNDGKGKFSIRQIISSDYGDQCGCETLATADTRPPSQIDTNHHPILISEPNFTVLPRAERIAELGRTPVLSG
jgi:hypothetical protein